MLKRENKKGKILLVALIIFVMVAGTAGFLFTGEDTNNSSSNYKNYKIYQTQDGSYAIEANKQLFPIDNLPTDLQNISFPNFQITSEVVYLLINPNDRLQVERPLQKLANVITTIGLRVNLACTAEKDCGDNPVITCKDRPSIIELRLDNTSKIFKQDNCLVLQGSDIEINKLADKVTLAILGIN